MASYNESAFKIKKSDIIIYIVALLAFVLMIVVLMSDKLGVTKRVTSLIGSSSSSQTAQIVSSRNETTINTPSAGESQTTAENSNSAASGSQDMNRELVNDLQRSENTPASTQSAAPAVNPEREAAGAETPSQASNETSPSARDNSLSTQPSSIERASGSNTRLSARNEDRQAGVSVERERENALKRARENSARLASAKRKKERVLRLARVSTVSPAVANQTAGNEALKVIKKVKVRAGDRLWGIAQRFGVRTLNIIKVNSFTNPNLIYPGQIINIPNK